ncbi:MAG: GNAT family N-acetyltransferase [Spirochaetaceae bacterium]
MEKCNNSHKQELLETIRHKAGENCFLYGDIENFSLDSDFMDVWRIKKSGITTSILLRYYKFYVVYCSDDDDIEEVSQIIKKDNNASGVSGLTTTVNKLGKYIDFDKLKEMFLAELTSATYKPFKEVATPQKAVESDLDDLFNFECTVEEFEVTEENRESFGQEVITGTGRIYFIKENEKIISTAALSAENSKNGMIIGVATNPDYRRKGFAKSCVGLLCKEMVEESKSVLLFYDNPTAGILYKDLGFVDINNWGMGVLKHS